MYLLCCMYSYLRVHVSAVVGIVCARERVQGRICRPGGAEGGGGGARFRFDPYRGGGGEDAPLANPRCARSPGGGEWFVCLFRRNGRAAAIGKNFIYMIEKCFPRGRALARSRRRRGEPPRRVPPPLAKTSSLAAERFYLFFFSLYSPTSESARGGS